MKEADLAQYRNVASPPRANGRDFKDLLSPLWCSLPAQGANSMMGCSPPAIRESSN